MICIVLAAGYATRLYPLTENFPKPLLNVGDKTILDHLLDDIDASCEISSYIIVSNHRYAAHFCEWADNKRLSAPISVLDDGTDSNETRLGAVADIQLAVERYKINDDIFVIAGDNVLDFSLGKLVSYFNTKKCACVMRYFEPELQKLRKCGVISVGQNDLITGMTEKPPEPQSHWCVPPFYIYEKGDVPLIKAAIEDGCGTDAPGSFIAWLCKKTSVYAMEMPGKRFDIGNPESYAKAQSEYRGIVK